jgi:hypothetical protein
VSGPTGPTGPAGGGGGSVTVVNDVTTSTDIFPLISSTISGTVSTINTSDAKLLYKPSTGELKSNHMVSTNGIMVNATTVNASYTIATGTNGLSVGPITLASGAVVTVASGQEWMVL